MKYLKLIAGVNTDPSLLHIENRNGEPVLAYKKGSKMIILSEGGSERSRLVKCSELKEILSGNMIKGTKFLAGTSNPVLYYLFPGNVLFNSDNDFIPTLPVSELVKSYEVNGFEESDTRLTRDSVRSMKACDNWFVGSTEYNEKVAMVDEALNNIYKHYKKFDPDKEILVGSGYSADVFSNSITVSLVSNTTFTDTINLEDWIQKYFNKDSLGQSTGISGKLDISYMYSIEGNIRSGMQTIQVYSTMLRPTIIDLVDIRLEYIGTVLKIYPLKNEVDEVMINDCVFTVMYQ